MYVLQEKADLQQRAQPGSEGCDTESHNNQQDQETALMKGEVKALRQVEFFKWTFFIKFRFL